MRRLVVVLPLIVFVCSASCSAGDYEDGWVAYERGDYKTALALLTGAANQGNALAQTALGLVYYKGRGVAQDYGQAIIWLRKAAEQGRPAAQLLLAEMYEQGKGGPQDYAAAYRWYSRAAADGFLDKEIRDMGIRGRDRVAVRITDVQSQAEKSREPAKADMLDQKRSSE
jgi:TPR repeat protein